MQRAGLRVTVPHSLTGLSQTDRGSKWKIIIIGKMNLNDEDASDDVSGDPL